MRTGLTEAPLDVAAMLTAVTDPGCGALAVFVGTVRSHNDPQDGREVVAIDYTGYESMAARTLERIAAELAAAAPGPRADRSATAAARGGEASIAIVAASPRREAALGAIRAALERVKSEAPIWKREIYADGGVRWREDEPLTP